MEVAYKKLFLVLLYLWILLHELAQDRNLFHFYPLISSFQLPLHPIYQTLSIILLVLIQNIIFLGNLFSLILLLLYFLFFWKLLFPLAVGYILLMPFFLSYLLLALTDDLLFLHQLELLLMLALTFLTFS